MLVTLDKQVVIEMTLSEWIVLEPDILPYIMVENKAYIIKQNAGFSVKDDIKTFSLGERTIEGSKVTLTTPIGLWSFIEEIVTNQSNNVVVKDLRPESIRSVEDKDIPKILYPYQKEAVKEVLRYNNGIIKSAAGSGKTLMGLALGKLVGKSVLWINDRIELAKQARTKAIELLGYPEDQCGLLQGDNEDIRPYTFTTIQKLTKVINYGFNNPEIKLRDFDVIIIDECHHAVGSYNNYKTYFQVCNELNYKKLYGLTATDKRADGNEHLVYALIGPVIHEVEGEVKTMPAVVKNYHCHIETPKEVYNTFLNKYTMKIIPAVRDAYLLLHPEYVEFIKPHIKGIISKYDKTLIVTPRVMVTEFWSDYLTEIGVDHFMVHGAIKKREKMYTAKIIVATLDLVKEGFDVPDIDSVISIGGLPSSGIKTQVVGRCERYLEGKKNPTAVFLIPHAKRHKEEFIREMNLDEL